MKRVLNFRVVEGDLNHYCFAELAVLTMVSIMILVWSKVFKFCLIHIISSLHTVGILWCSYIQRYVGFGDNIDTKVVESAINFWFKDDDYKSGDNKVYKYFRGA